MLSPEVAVELGPSAVALVAVPVVASVPHSVLDVPPDPSLHGEVASARALLDQATSARTLADIARRIDDLSLNCIVI